MRVPSGSPEFGVPGLYLDPRGTREEYDRELIAHLEAAGVEMIVLTVS